MPELAILEQRVLTGILEKYTAPPENVGQQLFKKKSHPFTTAVWDVIKGSRQRSTPTLPNREGRIVGQLGVGRKTASFIYVREKKAFEPSTLRWLREPGQMAKTNAEAAVRRELKDLNNRFDRLAESYCWEALHGAITVIYEDGAEVVVDMGFDPTHKPVTLVSWSNVTAGVYDADIIGDIYAWKKIIREDSGRVPTDIYLPGDIMELVYRNNGIKSLFSEKHKWQYLQTSTVEGLLGLDWHVYDGGYVADDEATFVPYINADKVIMISKANSPFVLLEGLSADFDAPKGHTGKFSKSWETKDPSARFILEEYNFIPVITYVDNVLVGTIVAAG